MTKRMKSPRKDERHILQLKVTLMESQPPIWRRILVRSSMPLDELHYLIQDVMGWTNSHLHEFVVGGESLLGFIQGGTSYSDKRFDEDDMHEDEAMVLIGDFLKNPGDALAYVYDFGDCWAHWIELEHILDRSPRNHRAPCCLEGERACPPDNCGGISGYFRLLDALADPKHEEHEDMKAWTESVVGGSFDPEAFDLIDINYAIRSDRTRINTERAMREGW